MEYQNHELTAETKDEFMLFHAGLALQKGEATSVDGTRTFRVETFHEALLAARDQGRSVMCKYSEDGSDNLLNNPVDFDHETSREVVSGLAKLLALGPDRMSAHMSGNEEVVKLWKRSAARVLGHIRAQKRGDRTYHKVVISDLSKAQG